MSRPPEHDHPHERIGDRHPARTFVDSWRFWAGLAFVILGSLFIFTVVTYSREASDRAARRAASQAQYVQCLAGIPFTGRINRVLGGIRNVGEVLLLNSIQVHEVTPPGSMVYRQQAENIRRLRKALNDQRAVTSFPVPTAAECRDELRRRG